MSLALVHAANPREPRDVFERQALTARESVAKIRRDAWRVYSAPFGTSSI